MIVYVAAYMDKVILAGLSHNIYMGMSANIHVNMDVDTDVEAGEGTNVCMDVGMSAHTDVYIDVDINNCVRAYKRSIHGCRHACGHGGEYGHGRCTTVHMAATTDVDMGLKM